MLRPLLSSSDVRQLRLSGDCDATSELPRLLGARRAKRLRAATKGTKAAAAQPQAAQRFRVVLRGLGELDSEMCFEVSPGPEEETPVLLHVYDVTQASVVRMINAVCAHRQAPVRLGGAFHVGVEVNGEEWEFGFCDVGSGVVARHPKTHTQHHYRETFTMPPTKMTPANISSVLAAMKTEYSGQDYDLLRKNCCHFANDLCLRLGCGEIPAWVRRFAALGSSAIGGITGLDERLGCLRSSRVSLSRPLSEPDTATDPSDFTLQQEQGQQPNSTTSVMMSL
mmetsp:Transcript_82897/g.208923  ORF Transcript_82897/g.208923 Transcript_82897/m.208923 type:complete len:281 (+) Transcript_82897:64-906(+)